MPPLENSWLSADTISTSSHTENPQPIHKFRLLTEGDFQAKIHALEFYWGLQRGDVNLFSDLNLVSIRADVAQLLWKDIALVPTQEVLEIMFKLVKENFVCDTAHRRSCFDALPVQEYEYKLLPLEDSGPPIFVLNPNGSYPRRIEFPYTNLPPLKLTLYPFFAVAHAGDRFLEKSFTKDPIYSHPIQTMYTIFSAPVPPEFITSRIDLPLDGNRQTTTTAVKQEDRDQNRSESADFEDEIAQLKEQLAQAQAKDAEARQKAAKEKRKREEEKRRKEDRERGEKEELRKNEEDLRRRERERAKLEKAAVNRERPPKHIASAAAIVVPEYESDSDFEPSLRLQNLSSKGKDKEVQAKAKKAVSFAEALSKRSIINTAITLEPDNGGSGGSGEYGSSNSSSEESDEVEEEKETKTMPDPKSSNTFAKPCVRCASHNYPCQRQAKPTAAACFACNKAKQSCSFLGGPKHRRGTNRGTTKDKGDSVGRIEERVDRIEEKMGKMEKKMEEKFDKLKEEISDLRATNRILLTVVERRTVASRPVSEKKKRKASELEIEEGDDEETMKKKVKEGKRKAREEYGHF